VFQLQCSKGYSQLNFELQIEILQTHVGEIAI